ncbi:MAG: dihydrofolate reductase [Muribaculaceae bacterium]|nr:dihydrofolate reductase [Muribaculaceae bacterium]
MVTVFPFDKDIEDTRDLQGTHPFSTFNSVTGRRRPVAAIVAMGRNGEIGFNGDMPWHLPEDMKHFKKTTMGHPVIMGRRTWESIPRRPLPGRRNVVITGDADYQANGAEIVSSPAMSLDVCPPPEIPFVIGGGRIYEQMMPWCTHIYVTRIDAEFPEADTYFPALCAGYWSLTKHSDWLISETGLRYRFELYERHNNQ